MRYDFGGPCETGFLLKSSADDVSDVIISSRLNLRSDHRTKDFSVHFLAKASVPENDIFQVIDVCRDDTRIGWCVPIAALGSSEHDEAENPYFLAYAYKGIEEVLKSENLDRYLLSRETGGEASVNISDLFHDDVCLLIISRETLQNPETFDVAELIPSLVSYGYVELPGANPHGLSWAGCHKVEDKIRVRPISAEISNPKMIASLLGRALSQEGEPLLRFFYIYQIVELLMESVFGAEQLAVVDELVSASTDISRAKQALERMQSIASEKKRINLLIDNYSRIKAELDDLRLLCNNLLRELELKEGSEFHEYFYSVRNAVFHGSRDRVLTKEEMVFPIVEEFLRILPRMLSNYAIPVLQTEPIQG